MERRTFVAAWAAAFSIPLIAGAQARVSGTVKWFDATKGFGFIHPDDGGHDVFVHIDAVHRAALSDLKKGQKISYVLETDRVKTFATALKLED